MPAAYQLTLRGEQLEELTQARDHHPLPYVRMKAAALLHEVGLLPDEVSSFSD